MSTNASLTPSSAPGSPKNRLKFLCSHGGKILHRPSDGKLKYVGGETRVISVHPDISFQEMMKKLSYGIDGEMILKYQVASEDLDALVTVKCDEDVRYMRDEIENARPNSRLRAFLFPAQEKESPMAVESSAPPQHQLYIDAINGIARTKQHHQRAPISPDKEARMMNMQRVRSSPNICSMTSVAPPAHHFVHHYPAGPGYQSPSKPPIDLQRNERRLISVRSVGRADGVRYQIDPSPSPSPAASPHYYTPMNNPGGGACACACCITGSPLPSNIPLAHAHIS